MRYRHIGQQRVAPAGTLFWESPPFARHSSVRLHSGDSLARARTPVTAHAHRMPCRVSGVPCNSAPASAPFWGHKRLGVAGFRAKSRPRSGGWMARHAIGASRPGRERSGARRRRRATCNRGRCRPQIRGRHTHGTARNLGRCHPATSRRYRPRSVLALDENIFSRSAESGRKRRTQSAMWVTSRQK